MMWLKRLLLVVSLLAALRALDLLIADNLTEYAIRIILFCGINSILAVGLNLINGTTGQFSIGHAGFMAVGAYTTAFMAISLENAFFPVQAGHLGFGSVALVFTLSLLAGAIFA